LVNFTREIALNDEYLSQFFLDRPVLWMTLKQLFKIFIKQPMFDCNRATRVLLRGQNQLLVPSERGKAPKPSFFFVGILPAVASNRSKAQSKDLRKLHCKHAWGFFLKKLLPVEIFFPNLPFIGQKPWDQHYVVLTLLVVPILQLTRRVFFKKNVQP